MLQFLGDLEGLCGVSAAGRPHWPAAHGRRKVAPVVGINYLNKCKECVINWGNDGAFFRLTKTVVPGWHLIGRDLCSQALPSAAKKGKRKLLSQLFRLLSSPHLPRTKFWAASEAAKKKTAIATMTLTLEILIMLANSNGESSSGAKSAGAFKFIPGAAESLEPCVQALNLDRFLGKHGPAPPVGILTVPRKMVQRGRFHYCVDFEHWLGRPRFVSL